MTVLPSPMSSARIPPSPRSTSCVIHCRPCSWYSRSVPSSSSGCSAGRMSRSWVASLVRRSSSQPIVSTSVLSPSTTSVPDTAARSASPEVMVRSPRSSTRCRRRGSTNTHWSRSLSSPVCDLASWSSSAWVSVLSPSAICQLKLNSWSAANDLGTLRSRSLLPADDGLGLEGAYEVGRPPYVDVRRHQVRDRTAVAEQRQLVGGDPDGALGDVGEQASRRRPGLGGTGQHHAGRLAYAGPEVMVLVRPHLAGAGGTERAVARLDAQLDLGDQVAVGLVQEADLEDVGEQPLLLAGLGGTR